MTRHDADKLFDAVEQALHKLRQSAGETREYTPEGLRRLNDGVIQTYDLLYLAAVDFNARRKVPA
jgi:hypothetical protein